MEASSTSSWPFEPRSAKKSWLASTNLSSVEARALLLEFLLTKSEPSSHGPAEQSPRRFAGRRPTVRKQTAHLRKRFMALTTRGGLASALLPPLFALACSGQTTLPATNSAGAGSSGMATGGTAMTSGGNSGGGTTTVGP